MTNNDNIFLDLINNTDFQETKNKFLNNRLSDFNEKIFINQVRKISTYLNKIQNEKVKIAVKKFVDEILNNENYSKFVKKEEDNAKVQKLVKTIDDLISDNNFIQLEQLYAKNKKAIDKYYPEFTRFWCTLPRNIDTSIFKNSCKVLLHKKKIKNLIHFTDIDNLKSILNIGIAPKQTLMEKNITYIFNDYKRLDNRLDCVCLSVEFPNKDLLDTFKTKYNKKYCIIVLDAESVLLNNKNKKYYVYCNAAREDAREWLKGETLCQDTYFWKMFTEDNTDVRLHCQYTRSSKYLKEYLPTNEQAEILYQGVISPKYIKEVYFESTDALNEFKKTIDSECIPKGINLVCNTDFFIKSRDEIDWEDR